MKATSRRKSCHLLSIYYVKYLVKFLYAYFYNFHKNAMTKVQLVPYLT